MFSNHLTIVPEEVMDSLSGVLRKGFLELIPEVFDVYVVNIGMIEVVNDCLSKVR